MNRSPTNIVEVRDYFAEALKNKHFTKDRLGSKTIELLGASFLADSPFIFGAPNEEYIRAELAWYESQSTNIHDIYGKDKVPPSAWVSTGDKHGNINSNYGHLIYSDKYFNQFYRVVRELAYNPDSRRSSMIYTRPSIWHEYNENGKSDFICTNSVTYYIRDNKLHAVVQMRSNDAWAGYRNDYAWQKHVLDKVTEHIKVKKPEMCTLEPGDIHWQVQNLHIYERNFYLVDHYAKTGETTITKKEYEQLYSL